MGKICFPKPGLTGLVYSGQGRIFNNMLYVRYIHLTKATQSLFMRDKPIVSSQRMLHKDYGHKGSVAKKKTDH
jgi:hypothetical protein